jgi:alpha-methylacyl-CoA racemase
VPALVLDMSRLLPGPLAGRILASLGFRVLRLTRPQGDLAESAAPDLYRWLNAGKAERQIDLKSEAGRVALLSLARDASVLLESDLPGVMERLGVGYEVLRAENPGLVYVRLAGYRPPRQQQPGHDLSYLAASGLLPFLGLAWKHVQLADLCGAFWTVIAALEGLRNGGGFYEVYLAEAYGAVNYPQPSCLNGSVICYGRYECAEGAVALAALEPSLWRRFCTAMNRPAWADHAFSVASPENGIYLELCESFRERTARQWEAWATTHNLLLSAIAPQAAAVSMPPWNSVEAKR